MIARNNVLNIRDNKSQIWFGSDGSTKGFVNFADVKFCIRAGLIILRSYKFRGIMRIEDVISTWAPASENNTTGYVKFVCDKMSMHRGHELDVYRPFEMFDLLSAMCKMETNYCLDGLTFDYAYSLFIQKEVSVFET